jgi:FkbM family methyltransferase
MSATLKEHAIGPFRLLLPADHRLDAYQKTWLRYDTALGHVAQTVFRKYPDSCAIDIGANVGDSAALIRNHADVPVLCVEGNPEYSECLAHNAALIGRVELETCFVGRDDAAVDLGRVRSARGTTTVVDAVGAHGPDFSGMKSLETILRLHPDFRRAKLLKSDTDGSDFPIIEASAGVISELRPVLYFEYDTGYTPDGEAEALRAMNRLFEIGYHYFLVYDNFGNYLISIASPEAERFVDLNTCLASNRAKSGTRVIFYFDICALAKEDADLFHAMRAMEWTLARS